MAHQDEATLWEQVMPSFYPLPFATLKQRSLAHYI